MDGGWSEPEEERKVFSPEVVADAHGDEVAGGDLPAHLADGVDDLGSGEGAHHDLGGEQTKGRGIQWQGCRGGSPAINGDDRSEMLEDVMEV